MMFAVSESSEIILVLISAVLLFIGVVSALGALYLHLKHARWLRNYAEDFECIGHGFDSTGVAPRVEAVRRDYLRELRARPHTAGHSFGRIAAARELVARLSYFNGIRAAEETLPEEPPSQITRHASLI